MATKKYALHTAVPNFVAASEADLAGGQGAWNFTADMLTIGGQAVVARVLADCSSTTNLVLTGAAQTIDGVAATAGKRVLAAGQTAPAEVGVYVAAAGAWTRVFDAGLSANVGVVVGVTGGTVRAGKAWMLQGPQVMVEVGSVGGGGLPVDNTTLSDLGGVLSVKDAGLTSVQVGGGIHVFKGLPASGWFGVIGLPVDGETATVTLGGVATIYEFDDNAAVTPGNVLVTIGGTPDLTAVALTNAIVANQATLQTIRTGVYVDINTDADSGLGAGTAMVLSSAPGINVVARNYGTVLAAVKPSVVWGRVVVEGTDVSRDLVHFVLRTNLIYAATIQVTRLGYVVAFNGALSIGGDNVNVSNGTATVPFVTGDVITLMAIGLVG